MLGAGALGRPTGMEWKQVLNDTLDEMDPTDILRTVHPNADEYTFFSSAHGTFSRRDHILGHKSNLSKFKKIEIVSSIYSDHNTTRLENKRKKTTGNANTWRLNNIFLNNWLLKKSKGKSKFSRNKCI